MDYSYCTIDEVRDDLTETGNDAAWLQIVQEATELVDGAFGSVDEARFVPFTETKRFNGTGDGILYIPDLLSSTPTIINDGDTLTTDDYLLYPRQRRWRYGPYSNIRVDPDATTLSVWKAERDSVSVAGNWGWYDNTATLTGSPTVQDNPQSDSQTTLLVATGLVKVGTLILIESELQFVTAVSTASPNDTLTVTRGALGTTAAAHNQNTAITRQIAPPAVRRLTQHVAGRLWKSRKSGYTGRTVNLDMGEVTIMELIPKAMLKPLKMKFRQAVGV